MRTHFAERFALSDDEKRNLWQSGVFVFDTNVLLNLYRMSQSVSTTTLELLRKLKGRLFIPHQVMLEFFRNRETVIAEQVNFFAKVRSWLEDIPTSFKKDFHRHPSAPLSECHRALDECVQTLISNLRAVQEQKPLNFINAQDPILTELESIFQGAEGAPWSEEEISRIDIEIEARRTKNIPPHETKDKKNHHAGDCRVWLQIVAFATTNQKGIVFVTADKQTNWWRQLMLGNSEKQVGPHFELIREITSASGQQFLMYDQEEFHSQAATQLQVAQQDQAIEEVRSIRIEESRKRELENFCSDFDTTAEDDASNSIVPPSRSDAYANEIEPAKAMLPPPGFDHYLKEMARVKAMMRPPAGFDHYLKEMERVKAMMRPPAGFDHYLKEMERVKAMMRPPAGFDHYLKEMERAKALIPPGLDDYRTEAESTRAMRPPMDEGSDSQPSPPGDRSH